MTCVQLLEANDGDLELLVSLMREFYEEAGYPLDPVRSRHAFAELQRQPALGQTYLVRDNGTVVGYLVLTVTFSMEYGGLSAFLDDLYLRTAYRGAGIGTQTMVALIEIAKRRGVRAIHSRLGRTMRQPRPYIARPALWVTIVSC